MSNASVRGEPQLKERVHQEPDPVKGKREPTGRKRSFLLTRTVDLCKEFQEEAFSVALHPTGLFILVGFSDKLRLMSLLLSDISILKEFTVRGCRQVS